MSNNPVSLGISQRARIEHIIIWTEREREKEREGESERERERERKREREPEWERCRRGSEREIDIN